MKKFLEKEFEKAVELKKSFKKVEEKKCNSLTVLNELTIQIGHYANTIKQNVYSNEKRQKD